MKESFYSLKRPDENVSQEERNKQALFECIINSDHQRFDELLPLVSVNDIRTKPLRSTLSMACQYEEYFVLKLLQNGADPNLQDQINRTPLMECCMRGNEEVVRALLKNNPSARKDLKDNYGNTALHFACQKGELEIVKLLLSTDLSPTDDNPCDVNVLNKEGKSPLFLAVENKSIEVVKFLLDHTKCDINCTLNNGLTLMMRACTKGTGNIVKLLLDHNPPPDINRIDPSSEKTCIMMAAHKSYEDICKMLLKHGCHLWVMTTIPVGEEKTVLDFAHKKIDDAIVQQMREELQSMVVDTAAGVLVKSVPLDVLWMVAMWTY